MTRVNLVPPSTLCDQHLLGEYHEICRIPQGVITGRLKVSYPDRPEFYTRGPGHMKFFTNKCQFIHERFLLVVSECLKRGFVVTGRFPDTTKLYELGCYWTWQPSPYEIGVSKDWLQSKMPPDPRWYRKRVRWPLTLVDNEDVNGRIPGDVGYLGPA